MRGATPQRLLWASTATKDPAYSDTRYVQELIAANVINTMPLSTLEAFADHGDIGRSLGSDVTPARQLLNEVSDAGVDSEIRGLANASDHAPVWVELKPV